jgi:hypothetical protein
LTNKCKTELVDRVGRSFVLEAQLAEGICCCHLRTLYASACASEITACSLGTREEATGGGPPTQPQLTGSR